MPHVAIKCYPRDLSQEQLQAIADDVSDLIKKHLGSSDSAISVSLNQVSQDNWKQEVYDVEIGPALDLLLKKPGYSYDE